MWSAIFILITACGSVRSDLLTSLKWGEVSASSRELAPLSTVKWSMGSQQAQRHHPVLVLVVNEFQRHPKFRLRFFFMLYSGPLHKVIVIHRTSIIVFPPLHSIIYPAQPSQLLQPVIWFSSSFDALSLNAPSLIESRILNFHQNLNLCLYIAISISFFGVSVSSTQMRANLPPSSVSYHLLYPSFNRTVIIGTSPTSEMTYPTCSPSQLSWGIYPASCEHLEVEKGVHVKGAAELPAQAVSSATLRQKHWKISAILYCINMHIHTKKVVSKWYNICNPH